MNKWFVILFVIIGFKGYAQENNDSVFKTGTKIITLSEIVVNNKLNVPAFIDRIKEDTSFYKAFKNLRILGFSAINDIRIVDKNNAVKASLHSKTRQLRQNGCRHMEVLQEEVSGDMYNKAGNFNYYTAEMYASLFFTKKTVCGENNLVKGVGFSTQGKHGMEKHKAQLKMLFFNPGKRINGIPFLSNKTAIFDEDIADKYEMSIDMGLHNGVDCYVFKQKVKPGNEADVVVDEMTTWFDDKTYEVIARNYTLRHNTVFYDFDVQMEVEMNRIHNLIVPTVIRYNGNWKAVFKKRERGIFTATLFDFN